mgnify:CR=1 FL=1
MPRHSNPTPARIAVVLVFVMLVSTLPLTQATQGRAGPDIIPTSAYVSYVSTTDHSNHAVLSSQNPSSIGMNRPADLWVIDGMLGLQQSIEVTLENVGDSSAGSFSVDIEILHDEYTDFILHSYRGSVSSISAGGSATVTTTWIPDYSGNHTIRVTSLLSTDANPSNDIGTRSLTIGNLYDRAETSGSWSLGSNWYVSDEASLSGTNSFHVGGQTSASNYGNNWDTSLVSSTMDTSDAHPNPTRGIGIGFFYTGSSWSGNPPADSGDGFDIDVWDGSAWVRISPNTVSGDIDTDFVTDGSSWLITLNQVGNHAVPYWGIPANTMNSQFKFRINFHSNAVGTNIGHWMEDIVMFYDQKARAEEFAISVNTGSSGHAQAGEWAETTVSLSNNGNLSDSVDLSVSNLPDGWNYRFQHMTGSQISEGSRLDLSKGETKTIKLLVQPAEGASMGSTTVNVHAQSTESSVLATTSASFIVDPGYNPSWVEEDPSFSCAPGTACDFEITLMNDGDGQDTFALSTSTVLSQDGWTFGLKWDQSTMVTIAEGATESVMITANLPQDAPSGMRASSAFTATSQADPNKVATMRANVTASMVSDAAVGIASIDVPLDGWWISPGESITVPFTIWNNASQQDSFTFSFEETGVFGWGIELLSSPNIIIGPEDSTRVLVEFTAPDSAQANDPGPIVTPHIISTESGMNGDESPFSGIRVRQLHDISLTMNTPEIDVIPGRINEIPFQVENLGNGAENVVFNLSTSSDWNWWVQFNSATITGPLSLSTSYDGNSLAMGTLFVEVPGNEDPNQVFELMFTASPISGTDTTPSDSEISWQYRTQMTAIPSITEFEESEVSLWMGQNAEWIVYLENAGNTYDSSMRIRVTTDKNLPGMLVQAVTNRGVGQLNGWVDIPMGPGGTEEVAIHFETMDNFPLGESVRLTLEVEGGRITSQDTLQTVSTEVQVTVDQKRSLSASWNLNPAVLFEPEQMSTFQINVTTDSTMPITVNLSKSVPDSVFVDCRPQSQNGDIILLLPASNPGPAQTGVIDCDISLQADQRDRTVEFELFDDSGSSIWSSGPVHLKTVPVDDSGGFAGFGSAAMLAGAIISVVIFIAFFVFMTTLILKRRRELDIIESAEDEVSESPIETSATQQMQTETSPMQNPVVQQLPAQNIPPGPMPGAPGPMPVTAPVVQQPVVEPNPEPSPQDFTDEQLLAAGWSQLQIQELRGTVMIQPSGDSAVLPTFNCLVTGQVLTANDSWWQCPSCGGFASSVAIEPYTHCPACNTPR